MSQPPDRPLQRTRLGSADLTAAWEKHAAEFIAWAKEPGHDSYWLFHRDQFLELVLRPIEAYVNALADAGLVVERLRETDVPDSGIV